MTLDCEEAVSCFLSLFFQFPSFEREVLTQDIKLKWTVSETLGRDVRKVTFGLLGCCIAGQCLVCALPTHGMGRFWCGVA